MAKFPFLQCSILGASVGFLLLSTVLVYASSTDQSIAEVSLLSSLDTATVTEQGICKHGETYRETTFVYTRACNLCDDWSNRICVQEMHGTVVQNICTYTPEWDGNVDVVCQCCCQTTPSRSPPLYPRSPPYYPRSPPPIPFPPQPSPYIPPPPPPPPSSPPPSPKEDTCDNPGDIYSEVTYPTTDCSYCKEWCKDECSDLGSEVVSNKCSIGESKFVRRCKCCCHENPEPIPPSCGCPVDLTVTLPGRGQCKYRLESPSSSLKSLLLPM